MARRKYKRQQSPVELVLVCLVALFFIATTSDIKSSDSQLTLIGMVAVVGIVLAAIMLLHHLKNEEKFRISFRQLEFDEIDKM